MERGDCGCDFADEEDEVVRVEGEVLTVVLRFKGWMKGGFR